VKDESSWGGLRETAEMCVEEVFVVALHALDGRVDDFDGGALLLEDAVADALDGGLAGVGVADDASFADVFSTGFELGLDEDDGFALPGLLRRAEGGEDCREDEGGGDEGDVHGKKRKCRFSAARRMTIFIFVSEEFARGEEAGVGALEEGDAGVVAELLGDLAVAGVYGEDRLCAVLQHAVGEASGGGSDVDAGEAGERDGPVGEGVLEFEAAAADVFEVGAQEADGSGGGDGGAGLVDALLVDEDTAGEDESLGALTGGSVALVDEELVEADLLGALFCGIGHLCALSHGLKSCLYLFMVVHGDHRDKRMRRKFDHFRVKLHWCRSREPQFPK